MQLDFISVLIADLSVTFVIGVVLLLAGVGSSANRALNWWGITHLVLCGGVVLLSIAQGLGSGPVQTVAITLILFGYSLMWHAARVFDRRKPLPILVGLGAILWLTISLSRVIAPSGIIGFSTYSLLTAVYCFAAAYEFWSGRDEPLLSRWPAVILQMFTGFTFVGWVAIALIFAQEGQPVVPATPAFPWIVLAALLARVAMAFVVLSMAKERLELTQRVAASTDALTGLPNRRGFFRRAIRHLRNEAGSHQWAAVLLFDLDHFKSINDRFGHATGDRILKVFADAVRRHLSAADYVGRIGGEEFAAFLPRADAARAAAVAERIRASFAESARSIDGEEVEATVSIGGVAMDCEGRGLDSLLGRADAALYSAKSAGRNCVKILGTTWHPGSIPAVHSAGSPSMTTSPPLAPAKQSAFEHFSAEGTIAKSS